jgi:hypothetical protein
MIEAMTKRRFACVALMLSIAVGVSAQDGEWRGPIRIPVWSIDLDGEFVTITYGLSEAASQSYDVSLSLANTEQRVLVEPDAVTGHVGTVKPGPLRKIIWHYRKDYPSGLRGRGWKFILNIQWGKQKTTVATREGTFTPPRLKMEELTFFEPNGNRALDAGEQGDVSFTVHNGGVGDGLGVTARISLLDPVPGLRVDSLLSGGDLVPGGAVRMKAVVSGSPALQTGQARLLVTLQDRFQYSTSVDTVTIPLQAFLPPLLEVTNAWIQSVTNPQMRKISEAPLLVRGDTTVVILEVKNRGKGKADSIRANIGLEGEGWNVKFASHARSLILRDLLPDSSDLISFAIVGEEKAEAESIYVKVGITERRSSYGLTDLLRFPARRRFLTFDALFADLMARRMFDSAAALCKRQMVLDPRRVSLYSNLADAYENMGDRARAVEMYVAAADRGDRAASAWLLTNATFKEATSVRYETMPMPFLDAGTTVSIGVFPMTPTDDDPAGERLYNALRGSIDRKRVILVPYRAMVSQLGVTSLNITDAAALHRAAKDLNITYIVDARDLDKSMQSFTVCLTRTADAQSVFSRRFQPSVTSTALQDVARMFKDSAVPVYNTKRVYKSKSGRGG